MAEGSGCSQGTPSQLTFVGRLLVSLLVVMCLSLVWHCVEPRPVDEHRVVLAAYVAGSVEKLGAQHRRYLEQLGFNLPSLSGDAAVEQQGGATPCDVSKNEKTHKNGKTSNVKSESVSPDCDEQAAECECCERDCPLCKNLFVGEESDSSSELGCDEFLLAGVESCDGFRPVLLEEAPVSAPQGEALEEGVEQALFLEPESETRALGISMSFSMNTAC